MKNIYLLIIITVFLNSCSNEKEPSLEEILATNDVELLKMAVRIILEFLRLV